jgi:hypothetical protein
MYQEGHHQFLRTHESEICDLSEQKAAELG